ncbi:hypothetical protein C5167_014996 [Papaver somniferum]|uniref:AMP-dependent synthetase/ligase domain-containing protein n=1 Tax=Papaver somniferum TaxID=3469 RepID=A0A4Y7J946_PAPSO|nr:hypothetical protein C5167_014996 [Papaver somniferum]
MQCITTTNTTDMSVLGIHFQKILEKQFQARRRREMKEFAVQVESGREGRDGEPSLGPIYRNLLEKDGFLPQHPDINTSWDIFRTSVEKYPGNRMLGWREIIDGKVGPYAWKTYKEVYDEVLSIGSALRASGAEPGARIGIYGSNCPQWIVAMEVCNAHSLICVPLYDTLGSGAVDYIIEHAEVDYVFVQDKKAKQVNPLHDLIYLYN